MLTKECRDQGGAAEPTDPNVQDDPNDTAAGGGYTKSMRLKGVRYPNGRYVRHAYPTALDEALRRVAPIREQLDYGYDPPSRPCRYGGASYNSNRTYRDNVLADNASKKFDELYAYDDLDRLIDFKRGKLNEGRTEIPYQSPADRLRREEWTLSETGNWNEYKIDQNGDGDYSDDNDLDQNRTHNAVNEIYNETAGNAITEEYEPQSSWADPACDSRGNMTTVPQPGAMTGTYTCVYDAWNRLVKVTDDENDDAVVAEYRYDGLNRRIRKYTPDASNWTVTEYYYNATWQVLEVRKEDGVSRSGSEPAVSMTVHEQYVWSARYIDAPILRDRDSDGDDETGDFGVEDSGLDERLYYLTDAHMCVTALVNTSGAAVERYHYDPYGGVTILDGTTDSQTDWAEDADQASDVANEVLWCGYRRDTETGLDHVRHRTYHPALGRWLQRDPLGYVDGMGLYEYAGSSPIGLLDPTGTHIGSLPPECWPVPKGSDAQEAGTTAAYVDAGVEAYRAVQRNRWYPPDWSVKFPGEKGFTWEKGPIGLLRQNRQLLDEAWNRYRYHQIRADGYADPEGMTKEEHRRAAEYWKRWTENSQPDPGLVNLAAVCEKIKRWGGDPHRTLYVAWQEEIDWKAREQALVIYTVCIGGVFRSRPYTTHAKERMATRNVSPRSVEQAIRRGRRSPGNRPGTTVYDLPASRSSTGRGVRVIVDGTGTVITVIDKGSKYE